MAYAELIREAGSFSTQILPELSYHLESSAGSLATLKIDRGDTKLWEKYSPEQFPAITWHGTPRNGSGKDSGSIYVLPRTSEGLVKIGFRGTKVRESLYLQIIADSTFQLSSPTSNLHLTECLSHRTARGVPERAVDAMRQFVTIFLPEFENVPF